MRWGFTLLFIITSVIHTWDAVVSQTRSTSTSKKGLIVTQQPLADTVVDWWRLIADESCASVVTLDEADCEVHVMRFSRRFLESLGLVLVLKVERLGLVSVLKI